MTLNDQTIFGGEEKSTTVGVNWYVNQNIRFMFNWVHGQVDKRNLANADIGAKYDAFGMRTQLAF
jgi:phosphate-selective porin OprO/OprP